MDEDRLQDRWAYAEQAAPDPGQRNSRTRMLLRGGALLAGGLVAGAVGIAALQGHSTASAAGAAGAADQSSQDALGAPPGGTTQDALPDGLPPGDSQGGQLGGGASGEHHLQGTITGLSAASVTVRLTDGTFLTVRVTAATDVRRDGATAALTQLKAGDLVLVHAFPSGSGTVAERVLAASSASRLGGAGVPGGTTAT